VKPVSWDEIRLTEGLIRDGVLAALQDEFSRLWQLVREREDTALFSGTRHEKGNGHGGFHISPGSLPWADKIISIYFGSPCDKPQKTAARPKLFVGHPEAEGLIE
jgi:hypothetical protein